MKEFGKWFKEIGWKKYVAAWALILLVNFGFISNYEGIWTDGGYGADTMHTVMVALGHVAIIGANVGMMYHMISAFKRRNM